MLRTKIITEYTGIVNVASRNDLRSGDEEKFLRHGENGRARQRLGRPPKPPHEVRSERVVSFVTPVEFETLMRVADDRGLSVSAVIHLVLSAALAEED